MQSCALLHGATFETAIPTIGEKGFGFEKLIRWSTGRAIPRPRVNEQGIIVQDPAIPLLPDEDKAIEFLTLLLELDPKKRISAEQALQHEFFDGPYDVVYPPPHVDHRSDREDGKEQEQEQQRREGTTEADSNGEGREEVDEERDDAGQGEEEQEQHYQRLYQQAEEYDPYRYD